jgi:RNA polymerase sigma-70 factor (ECF subfamily)
LDIESEHDCRDDQGLIAAANDGECAAFEVLYHRYRDWVAGLAFRFTGDRDLALDILQETFIYFLKKFPGFTLTCQLKTFLYPVVKHLSLQARRKADRYSLDDSAMDEWVETAPAPVSTSESAEALTDVLANLSEQHREVLLLRFLDGLSLQEIAIAIEIPLGTVKSRLHHALESLRQDERTRKLFEE